MILFFFLLVGEKGGSGDGRVLLMRASLCQNATSMRSVSPQTAHREKEMTARPEGEKKITSLSLLAVILIHI